VKRNYEGPFIGITCSKFEAFYGQIVSCLLSNYGYGISYIKAITNLDYLVEMFDVQGYLPPPNTYDVHKSRPADNSLLVKHSGVCMQKTLKCEPPDSDGACYARAVKPEAAGYAERNRGTVGQVLTDFGRPTTVSVSGTKGLRTEAAQEIARKYQQGSVSNLLC
jgi:hypothetical protein